MIRLAAVICALVAALMLPRHHYAGASELFANGGFEEGTAGWSTNAGQLDSVTSPLHGGSQAGRFSGSGQPSTQFAYQLTNVQPASTYELSGWVAAPPSGVNRVFLRVSWFDVSGSIVLSSDSPWLAQPDGAFHPLATGAMVSPIAARQARASILIQADSAFTVHLDDFAFSGPTFVPPPPTPPPAPTTPPQITPMPTPLPPGTTPGPLPTPTRTPGRVPTPKATSPAAGSTEPDSFPQLINGGFEELRIDGTPFAWHKQGGEMSASTEQRTEGERGLALVSETASTKWAYETVSAQPGGYYEGSVQALAGPGAESAFLRLSWYASADGGGQAIASIDSLDSVQSTAQAFRRLTTGPVQAPAGANSVKLRLMLRAASAEPAAAYFDNAQFGTTQPGPGESVRLAGSSLISGGEDASLAEVAAPDGLVPGAATPSTIANVKPSRPGADAPTASGGQGQDNWAILLAIGVSLAAIALVGGHEFWQRKYARKGRVRDL